MSFDIRRQKAFDFYGEVAKLLITLSTGLLAFTVVLIKEFPINLFGWIFIVLSWLALGASIVCGIAFISSLVGQLEPGDQESEEEMEPSIWREPTNSLMKKLQVTFGLGIGFVLLAAIISYSSPKTDKPPVINNVEINNHQPEL